MDYHFLSGVIAIIGGLIANGMYLRDAWTGKSHPHAFTWFIWGVNACTAAGLGFWGEAYISAATFAANGLLYLAVSFVSAKNRTRPNTRMDWAALIVALSILPIWAITNEALLASLLVCLIGITGAFPTMRKTWSYPHEENVMGFGFYSLMSLLGVFAVVPITFVTMLYPITCLVVNTTVFVATILRRRMLSSPVPA